MLFLSSSAVPSMQIWAQDRIENLKKGIKIAPHHYDVRHIHLNYEILICMRYFSQHTHLTIYKVGLSVGQPSELYRTFVGKKSDFRRT